MKTLVKKINEANERLWRQQWLAEGRSIDDYRAGLDDPESEVWDWRRAKGRAAIAAEREAWLADHPGNPLPEHLCSMTDAEYAEYLRWSAEKGRKQ